MAFAYGSVEERVLEMQEGAAVEFGPAARVEVLRLVPGRISSSEWGGGTDTFRFFFHRPTDENIEPRSVPQFSSSGLRPPP